MFVEVELGSNLSSNTFSLEFFYRVRQTKKLNNL